MKHIVRAVDIDKSGRFCLKEVQSKDVVVPTESIMSIDGSTATTGVGILREKDGALMYTMALIREHEETPVQYKVRLKRFILDILNRNRLIKTIYYEEPFIGYAGAATNLLMLRTFIDELKAENEPHLDYIKNSEINNKKWKKQFLAPDKCPGNSELEKEAVRVKLVGYLPFLKDVTQDEIDAIAMGYVAIMYTMEGREEQLESKKKVTPFKYNIEFIGAENEDSMLEEFSELYSGPKKLLENGILMETLGSRANFDKSIYEIIGSDDKVLILKFSSNHHGNIILQHRIGHLAASYSYIYAIIWRKARKRN